MVWGAMNPPRSDIEVSVEKLERAFQGRFKKVIKVLAQPKMRHYVDPSNPHGKIGERVARICLRWWWQLIKGKGESGIQYQDIITPRVLEYIMETCQFLEDWKNGKADPRLQPLTPKLWKLEFDTVCQHHHLSEDTTGITLPFNQLRMAFFGHEMYGLTDLLDTSPHVGQKLKEIAEKPEAAKMAASVILQGIKSTRIHPMPLMPFYRIGEFSKVLTAMKPDDANIVINGQPQIAGFLAAKCLYKDAELSGADPTQLAKLKVVSEQLKRDYSKSNMDHPVWKEVTDGEIAIFRHLKYTIMQAVRTSAGFKKTASPSGAPATKPGVGTPAPKKPGVP
jgi:hypothetical protein